MAAFRARQRALQDGSHRRGSHGGLLCNVKRLLADSVGSLISGSRDNLVVTACPEVLSASEWALIDLGMLWCLTRMRRITGKAIRRLEVSGLVDCGGDLLPCIHRMDGGDRQWLGRVVHSDTCIWWAV